jgi:hypothetical protein
MAKWLLDDALNLFRMLQDRAKSYGYCLAIGGGVVNKGWSDNDLDIVAHCHTEYEKVCDPNALLISLTGGTGGKQLLGWQRVGLKQAGPIVISFFESYGREVEIWFPYHSLLVDCQTILVPGERPPSGGPCAKDLEADEENMRILARHGITW